MAAPVPDSVRVAGEGAGPAPVTTPSKMSSAAVRAELMSQIKGLAEGFGAVPEICKRRRVGEPDVATELGVQVADWEELRRRREEGMLQAYGGGGGAAPQPSALLPTAVAPAAQPATFVPANPQQSAPDSEPETSAPPPVSSLGLRQGGRAPKASKSKGGSNRTYTSKYRGVHQTFPTRRWEAQFRRNGKPTSLGCFDLEEEAARSYDKMMLWCELHNAAGVKGGITNFDPSEYEPEVAWLQQITQDDLVQLLRSEGRRQAAQRMLKQKRDGQALYQTDAD